MPDNDKRLQVQIQVMGTDGKWFTPAYQPAAALAGLRAIAGDIQELPGSYPRDRLQEIRDAARGLADAVASLLPAEASEDRPAWAISYGDLAERAGRPVTETEVKRIVKAIEYSTAGEAITDAVYQVCGFPPEEDYSE